MSKIAFYLWDRLWITSLFLLFDVFPYFFLADATGPILCLVGLAATVHAIATLCINPTNTWWCVTAVLALVMAWSAVIRFQARRAMSQAGCWPLRETLAELWTQANEPPEGA